MCTALTYQSGDFYFGRNLDLDRDYGEKPTAMPRSFSFPMKCMPALQEHYAMIGMAVIADGVPLFFEATNEKGLSAAGLNFPGNAFYGEAVEGKVNLAPYELIPWVLGSFSCIDEARVALQNLNLINAPFNDGYPLTPLHWIISGKSGSLTVESTKDGLKIYENEWGVLSNNPSFDEQLKNKAAAVSIPGDFSSAARFVRAACIKEKASPKSTEEASVSQFFRMLSLVSVPEGCLTKDGKAHYTRYASCCDTDKGVYYYNRSESCKIEMAAMWECDLSADELLIF